MAKVLDPAQSDRLHERDFAAWASRQAELLRARRFDDLDIDHLIEEVDDLALNARKAVLGRGRRILQHFLKLQYSPATWPRRGWRETIVAQRSDLEDMLTSTLKNHLAEGFEEAWRKARRDALRDLQQDGLGERDLPDACPYTLDQILDPDWWPANRHGLTDPTAGGA